MRIAGSCHCRNISFVLDWQPEPREIGARACDCSFCTRHGAAWTACKSAPLALAIAEPALVSPYSFATRTAAFQVCTRCGVVPVVTSRVDDELYAVVNVNTFEAFDRGMLRIAPMSFGDESEAVRLARRKRNWMIVR